MIKGIGGLGIVAVALLLGCNDAKDKEIAALRAQLAEKKGNAQPPAAGGLGAVKPTATPVPTPAATPISAAPPAAEAPAAEADSDKPAATLQEALEHFKPLMGDTTDKHSPGAIFLASWASRSLKFADVGLAKNETTRARVMKDSDAERGKRMCFGGYIVEIAKVPREAGIPGYFGNPPIFAGLINDYGDIVSFFAVGSTGNLVERSGARFCGVVTGRYDYQNSGGGVSHAVQMVGMFDIAENNPRKKRSRSDDE